MSTLTNQVVRTLAEVMTFMKPFAGGSVPDSNSDEYLEWRLWIQSRQEEYARRGFWRRLLKSDELTLSGETAYLPEDFHKHNGLYVLDVDGVDWAEDGNADGMTVFVEMDSDLTTGSPPVANANFGKWRIRLSESVASTTSTIWYFCNPPKPVDATDVLLLPGDLVGYGALIDYYRQANQEGSMDKAEQDAENRFTSYLSLEMIPPKYELLNFATHGSTRVDRLATAKSFYSRTNRNNQY